jgi:hypothetical protein
VTAKHRGGRRSWRRRVPGVLVAILAAASAAGVMTVALQGTGSETAAAGAAGAAGTLTGGGVARARRHRGHHRVSSANPPPMSLVTDAQLQPSVVVAMSTPPLPAGTILQANGDSADRASTAPAWWAPPLTSPLAGPHAPHHVLDLRDPAVPALFVVPQPPPDDDDDSDPEIDPMVDTVPHPVIKLFPLEALELDRAAGSIDDRVFAAFDAERRHLQAAALAGGRHAADHPTDAAAPRTTSYRSRHSA